MVVSDVASETRPEEPDPREAALGTSGLTKRFGGVVAVDDVSLSVPSGELRAIIGPNGAGKTTLFDVVTNALSPTEGTVWLDGRNLADVPQERRPHLGLVRSFQSNQLFNDLSVLESVRVVVQTARTGTFGFDLFRDGGSVYTDRAMELLDRVGLEELHAAEAATLSHGDQRRLGIAMALATDPSVLLLDEPTSGMGSSETQATADLIASLQSDLDLTVVLIEHDMGIVLSMSDRITVLDRGSVIATDTPDAIRENEAVQDAYLGGMEDDP